MNLHDPKTYAGEKGGANRDLIMNNPAFARTRENMKEFAGCGLVVKSIRRGLNNLLPDQVDRRFSGRLISLVKVINRNDIEGERGKRSIVISASRPLLMTLQFNRLQGLADKWSKAFVVSHAALRTDATLKVTGFNLKPTDIQEGATFYRLLNHLSVISDYNYSEKTRRYEPVDALDGANTFLYSEYTPVETALTVELKATFPEGTLIGDECSVIQCVGIEFYLPNGTNKYKPAVGNSLVIKDVF